MPEGAVPENLPPTANTTRPTHSWGAPSRTRPLARRPPRRPAAADAPAPRSGRRLRRNAPRRAAQHRPKEQALSGEEAGAWTRGSGVKISFERKARHNFGHRRRNFCQQQTLTNISRLITEQQQSKQNASFPN